MPTNNWSEWQNCVLGKLDAHGKTQIEHGKKIDKQSELITKVRIDVAKLKTSARIWGAIAGFIGAAVLVYIQGML